MKKILDVLTSEFENAFEKCGYDKKLGKVGISNRPDLCEYQCNGAMAGAKLYKKAPIMIANDVVEQLKDNKLFDLIEAVMPGFINIKLSADYIDEYVSNMNDDERLGYEKKEPITVIVDYGGANVAKPLHVGHLRPAIIGESVKRICRYAGDTVYGDVHLGDWGLPIGQVIEELRDRQPELPYFDENFTGEYPTEPPFSINELEDIYPTGSGKCKVDEEFKKRAQDTTAKLQQGNKAYMALWRHIMNVSKADLKKNYKNLNVEFDLWKGESDAQPYIPDMIDDFVARGFAHESQGALVVDVARPDDKKELPPCIVRKHDGAALYATSDLATLIEREKDYHPGHVIYVVDKRQELHFTQVFRVAKMTGIVGEDTPLTFIGFGTMNGTDGKPFKTRDGGVMRLEMLISDVSEKVYEKILENRDISEEEAREISKIIGLAAIKYGDLSNQATKDYVFDIDRFTSFEGNTGPYILYTIVRIKSILKKYAEQGNELSANGKIVDFGSESERSLKLVLTQFNDVMEASYNELAPHRVCAYIYEVANAFNRFYHENNIMNEENADKQKSYINLLTLTKKVLEQCIDLLAIDAPEHM